MARRVIDCSDFPRTGNCTLTIDGEEYVGLPIATYHAVRDHGEEDSEELQRELRARLKDEGARHTGRVRKVIDCRDFPFNIDCTLTIAGEESVVLPIATYHAIRDHGDEKDSPELQRTLRAILRDE